MEQAARESGQPPKVVARAPRMPHRAPLVVVVVARCRPHPIVSVFEQQLCAGCAVFAMQLAAMAQGYGGVWRSGWPMANRGLHDALGLAPDDQIVGFLYLGTPAKAKSDPPPDIPLDDYRRWL